MLCAKMFLPKISSALSFFCDGISKARQPEEEKEVDVFFRKAPLGFRMQHKQAPLKVRCHKKPTIGKKIPNFWSPFQVVSG